jgi:hypothetical protein
MGDQNYYVALPHHARKLAQQPIFVENGKLIQAQVTHIAVDVIPSYSGNIQSLLYCP